MDRCPLLQALADREEEANRNGKMTTIIFIRDRNQRGQEVSGYIDYSHRLKVQSTLMNYLCKLFFYLLRQRILNHIFRVAVNFFLDTRISASTTGIPITLLQTQPSTIRSVELTLTFLHAKSNHVYTHIQYINLCYYVHAYGEYE